MADENFMVGLDIVMHSEVGPWFDASDPDTIAGNIGTREQQRKVGYVNDPSDSGGETKFGVAQSSHPNLSITELTLAQACDIYKNEYWAMNHCDKLPYPIDVIHFDGGVNMGSSRATIFLQAAAGVKADGSFGPQTLRAVLALDPWNTAIDMLNQRAVFYTNLAVKKPQNAKFLKGWLARVTNLTNWVNTEKSKANL